jgi:DNA-directed RNA polymerase specialized sigma24 family protein
MDQVPDESEAGIRLGLNPISRPGSVSPDPTSQEPGLIARTLAGDRAAFAALVQPHLRLFSAGIHRVLLDEQDTRDVLEQALLNIRMALPGVAECEKFPVWAYRLCLSQALSRRRSRVSRESEGFTCRFPEEGF